MNKIDSEVLKKSTRIRINGNTRAMRILSIIPGEAEGSQYIFIKRQVKSLEAAGISHQPFYLASRVNPKKLYHAANILHRDICSFQPDLIHAHYGTMTGFFAAICSSLPLVITFRGSDLNFDPESSRLRCMTGKVLSQYVALRASHIICVSSLLKNRLWWKQNNCSIIPSGVDTSVFFPRPRDEARQLLGWQPEERVILFNRGIAPRLKRLDLAQAAIRQAEKICGTIRFVVLEGKTEANMVPLLMNAADGILVTSDQEGSPNIVKEALACNVPVVSVDVGDVPERVQGVRHSFIVPRDPEKIGQALATILQNPVRSDGSWHIRNLTDQMITFHLLQIYQKVLGHINNFACQSPIG